MTLLPWRAQLQLLAWAIIMNQTWHPKQWRLELNPPPQIKTRGLPFWFSPVFFISGFAASFLAVGRGGAGEVCERSPGVLPTSQGWCCRGVTGGPCSENEPCRRLHVRRVTLQRGFAYQTRPSSSPQLLRMGMPWMRHGKNKDSPWIKTNSAHIDLSQLRLGKHIELEVPYRRIREGWVTAMEGTADQTSLGAPSLMGRWGSPGIP